MLYSETKCTKRSRYLVIKQTANIAWVFPEIPAQLLVFQILVKRIIMAMRWDISPNSRNVFIFQSEAMRNVIFSLNLKIKRLGILNTEIRRFWLSRSSFPHDGNFKKKCSLNRAKIVLENKHYFSLKIVNSERGNHIRICSSCRLRMRYLILFKHSIIFLYL